MEDGSKTKPERLDAVVGVDNDGCLICIDEMGNEYNCGETLEQYGRDNLTSEELRIVLSKEIT